MPDAIGERPRAIHRPTGGALQDLEFLRSGIPVCDGTSNLDQQRAERLANAIMNFARQPLAFDGELTLPAAFDDTLILEPAGDPQDMGDPAGDQLEDGDPLGRQRLAA